MTSVSPADSVGEPALWETGLPVSSSRRTEVALTVAADRGSLNRIVGWVARSTPVAPSAGVVLWTQGPLSVRV